MIFGLCPSSNIKNTQHFEGQFCLHFKCRYLEHLLCWVWWNRLVLSTGHLSKLTDCMPLSLGIEYGR
jgi:hypothetical protein